MMIVFPVVFPLGARYVYRCLSLDVTEGKPGVGFFHLFRCFQSKKGIVCRVCISPI